ncbi:MAG TPA: DUF2892 domain-containing protein [Acidiferrobacterales bacterium]
MKRNMNGLDQVVRGVIGVAAGYLGFIEPAAVGDPVLAALVGLFGVLNVFSAFTAYCPVYHLAGMSSAPGSD